MSLISSPLFLIVVLALAAICGYKYKSLTLSGAITTLLIGIVIIYGFGIKGLFLIGVFFVTSSFWSKFKREKKKAAEEKNHKGGRRDGIQVLANGGVPAIISMLAVYFQNETLLYMFITALATANSDTWASEIGSISRMKPIDILSLKKVEAGTSGAMSLLGTGAALLGSFLIGIVSYFLWNDVSLMIALIIGLVGFLGNLVDTLLGATVQVTYYCRSCYLITEKTMHCNVKTNYKRGFRFFNNEVVNFLSIMIGSFIVLLFT